MEQKPRIIIATQINEGNWIDPYAAKRRKNARGKQRREIRREEELMRPPESDSESEDSVTESSMWDAK